MDTQHAILTRRAVKHYDSTFEIPAADEQKLLELARNAPTSFNIQNWRFCVVKDKALRADIKKAAWGQEQVTDASLLIVMCADLKAWDKDPARYWAEAPQAVQDVLVPMIKPFYEGKEGLQRDEAMRSIGIAAQTIMLAAKDMGYDSCPMIGFDSAVVADLIHLPADHVIGMLLVVGKATKPANTKGGFLPVEAVVIQNHF